MCLSSCEQREILQQVWDCNFTVCVSSSLTYIIQVWMSFFFCNLLACISRHICGDFMSFDAVYLPRVNGFIWLCTLTCCFEALILETCEDVFVWMKLCARMCVCVFACHKPTRSDLSFAFLPQNTLTKRISNATQKHSFSLSVTHRETHCAFISSLSPVGPFQGYNHRTVIVGGQEVVEWVKIVPALLFLLAHCCHDGYWLP